MKFADDGGAKAYGIHAQQGLVQYGMFEERHRFEHTK